MADDQTTVAAFVIRHHVRPGAEEAYKSWQKTIADRARGFTGHISASTYRPEEGEGLFVTVIQFDTRENADAWIHSATRAACIADAKSLLLTEEQAELQEGIEYWFEAPHAAPASPPRARSWKQFLVTWSAIYPLTVLVPMMFQPLYSQFPIMRSLVVGNFFVSLVIVWLMVYAIMPRYTRRVSRWLFR